MRIRKRLICYDLENGFSVKEVADKYDCNLSTVYRIKKSFAKRVQKN